MNRQMKRHMKPLKTNKASLEYREGIKEGIRQERARFVLAMENTKGIGEELSKRILEEVVKLYK